MACLFCQIAQGEIPATVVYKEEGVTAFRDIAPQAPTHVLIVPKKEIVNLASATAEDQALLGHLLLVARQVAEQLGLSNGYRVVLNCGRDGGQSVDHLHLHLLGGRTLHWPPG